jgi:hypothetical protein
MKVTCQPKSVRTRKPGGQTPFGMTCELGPTAVSFGPRSDLNAAVSALAALPPPARTGPSRKVRLTAANRLDSRQVVRARNASGAPSQPWENER